VADPEARDRRVIGRVVGGDHAKRDIVAAAALDRPRRAHRGSRRRSTNSATINRRIMGRATPAVVAIAGVERGQIHLANGVEHEPRQMLLGQPLAQARRQQQLLLAVTRE
jgi:hypothetical protein